MSTALHPLQARVERLEERIAARPDPDGHQVAVLSVADVVQTASNTVTHYPPQVDSGPMDISVIQPTLPPIAVPMAQPAATKVILPPAAPTMVVGDSARRTSPSQRSRLPTPLYIARLMTLLSGISNCFLSDFILNGLQHGFPIGHSGASVSTISGNLSTAFEHAPFVQQQIADRVRHDESAGHFSVQPFFHPFVCSPLGVVPKNNGKLSQV